MARGLNRLTAVEVKNATGSKPIEDGGGLRYIPSADRWVLRYTSPVTRKRRDAGLGPLTLKAARERAGELRRAIALGRDPLLDRDRVAQAEREARALGGPLDGGNTLEEYAKRYHETISPSFRNAKHRAQWIASLKLNVFDTLGKKPIGEITAAQVLDLMLELQKRVPATAARVRMRLAAVFDEACLRGHAVTNPAAVIKRRLRDARPRTYQDHHASMPFRDVPAFVKALRGDTTSSVASRLALEFTILAAARTGETIGAERADIHGKLWIVPAHKMKAGKAHRVPLTPRMLAILAEAKAISNGGPFIFPSPTIRKRPLSQMAMLMLLRRMEKAEAVKDAGTVHGFRGCFSSWAREKTKFRVEVIEAALAHREQDRVAAAYSSQATYMKERVALAQAWEKFVSG